MPGKMLAIAIPWILGNPNWRNKVRNNKILLQFLPGLQKLFCIVPVGLLTDFWMAPDTTRTFPPTTTLLYLLKLLLGLLCDENSWRDEAVFCSVVIGLLSTLRFFAATLATFAQDRKSRSPSFSAVSNDATCFKTQPISNYFGTRFFHIFLL